MIMTQVTLYTKDYCPYCVAAKELLASKEAAVEEINLTADPDTLGNLVEKTGQMTVPQIFIGDEFIGGFDDLKALDEAGELDAKLAA